MSLLRIVVFLTVLAMGAAGAVLVIKRSRATAAASTRAAPWFAPYVDVTLTPTYAFQSPVANPVGNVALGFVVARNSTSCTPSWGGYYTLDAAAGALNLDARIAQVKAQGGSPTISFGGQANTELAVGCTDAKQLAEAYLEPVQRYHVDSIDLDIEGSNLTAASDARRATAIAADQKTLAASGQRLGVWLTLPVSTAGLTAAGIAAVKDMLDAGVELQGVNLLAMDFGPGVGSTHGMIGPVRDALNGAHGQLQSTFGAAGLGSSAAAAWHRIGATVMIGQNDIANERFTLDDARQLITFVAQNGLARLSMWSLNRDSECGSVFAQVGVLSNTCSGIAQTPLQFTHVFSQLPGTSTARTQTAQADTVPQVAQAPPDNPAASPYPIWDATSGYVAGYKVVWHRSIYQAKWFSQGAAPDAPAQSSAPSPWLLIGPITPGAHARKPELLDTGNHPTWSASTVYRQGARVMYKDLPYLARYYSHAQPPSSALPAQAGAAWQPLFTAPGEPAGAVR
ncbi:MAG TPA: chitinase [Solirubrobacteraceae bacterium]